MDDTKTIVISGGEKQFETDGPGGVYITRSLNHFFLMRVSSRTRRSGKITYTISVSPTPHDYSESIPDVHESTCMEVTIWVFGDSTQSHIEYIAHEKTCAMCKPLERKTGTYEMVMSTLSFCSKLFGSNTYSLHDASRFMCDPIEQRIVMRDHNLLVHGKSWYERKFDAKPKRREDKILWSDIQSRLNEVVDDDIMIDVVQALKSNTNRSQWKQFLDIMNFYSGRSSWTEMFRKIDELENSCVFFQEKILHRLSHEHVLNIPEIREWVIEIEKNLNDERLLDYKRIY